MPTISKPKIIKGNEDTALEISYQTMLKNAKISNDASGFKIGAPITGSLEYYNNNNWIEVTSETIILTSSNAIGNGLVMTDKIRYTPDKDSYGPISLFDIYATNSNGGAWDLLSASERFTANLKNVNDAPIMTSQDASLTIDENDASGTLYTVQASDVDSPKLKYSLTGADAKNFKINTNGEVTFSKAFDYEKPKDSNADNQYVFSVVVSDGKLSDSIALTVDVQDINESTAGTTGGSTSGIANGSGWTGGFPEGWIITTDFTDYPFYFKDGEVYYLGNKSFTILDLGVDNESTIIMNGQTTRATMKGSLETGITITSYFNDTPSSLTTTPQSYADISIKPGSHWMPEQPDTSSIPDLPGIKGTFDGTFIIITTIGNFEYDIHATNM